MRIKRCLPSAANVVLVAAVALVAFARTAYAYVDPSVVTYTIQALAAVAVALSAVAGVAFRRTRKVFFKMLGIDEDAGKIAEPEVSRIEPAGKIAADLAAKNDIAEAAKPKTTKKLKWWSRFWRALIAAEALAFTLLIVAPLELVAGNQKWLLFTLDDVAMPVFVAGLVAGLVLAILLSILRGRVFTIALCITAALAVCCYVEALLLNGPLPVADGSTVIWDDYTKITVISAAVWAFILLIAVLIAALHQRIGRFLALAGSLALIIVQGVGVWSLWSMPMEVNNAPISISQEGLFDVSRNNNVVVFVLDACDTRWFEYACELDPTLVDALDGFVYYRNAVGSMSPTRYAIPYLLTAQRPQPSDENADTYIARRYKDGTFLEDLANTGYDIGIYSDSAVYSDPEREILAASADNVTRDRGADASYLDPVGAVKILWKCACYRDMTWLLKPYFWYYGDQINMQMLDANQVARLGAEHTPYVIDDVTYYQTILANELKYNDEELGSFRFIHLMGSHYPWDMTANVERVEAGESTVVEQTVGAFKIVRTYIDQLKAIGAFENTTIIITADHGKLYTDLDTLWEVTNPIMLVKYAGLTEEQASAPLTLNNAPISHADLHSTILALLGADQATVASYEGDPLYTVAEDAERPRYYYMTSYNSTGSADRFTREYLVGSDSYDLEQWQETGNIWYFEDERGGFNK